MTSSTAPDSARKLADKSRTLGRSSNWHRCRSHQRHIPSPDPQGEHTASRKVRREHPKNRTKNNFALSILGQFHFSLVDRFVVANSLFHLYVLPQRFPLLFCDVSMTHTISGEIPLPIYRVEIRISRESDGIFIFNFAGPRRYPECEVIVVLHRDLCILYFIQYIVRLSRSSDV